MADVLLWIWKFFGINVNILIIFIFSHKRDLCDPKAMDEYAATARRVQIAIRLSEFRFCASPLKVQ